MQVLDRYISNLNLGTTLNYQLFFVGLIIKIVGIFIFSSPIIENLFLPFIEYFINSNFSNPYENFSNLELESFPYPVAMLFIISMPAMFLQYFFAFEITGWMLKLPLLICDIFLFFIIKSWLNHRYILQLIALFWLSPVMYYISYIYGQLDIVPISLLLISLYFLFRNDQKISAIFFGISLASKTMILITLPFLVVFLYSQRQSLFSILIYLLIGVITFVLINLVYLENQYFYEMVFNNSTQGKIFDLAVSFADSKIYLLPIAYIFLFFGALHISNFNKDNFISFLTFAMGIFLVFTTPSEGWFMWFLPFLIYLKVKNRFESYFVIIGLQISYLTYFLINPSFPFLDGTMTYLLDKFQIIALSASIKVDEQIFISQTILIAFLLISCFLILQGFLSLRKQKIFSTPYLIGIGGNSGSGKTTISLSLRGIFGKHHSLMINGDDLHKWERGDKNWEKFTHLDPRANELHLEIRYLRDLLNGKKISRKKYNHLSGVFEAPQQVHSSNIIFYEGLHPFFIKKQRDIFDLKIFLNPDKKLNDKWKIKRDTSNRNKSEAEVIEQIKSRESDLDEFITMQEKFADIVITPIEIKDDKEGQHLSYEIRFSNSISFNQINEIIGLDNNINLEHSFLENDMQKITLSGKPSISSIQKINKINIDKLNELGIINSEIDDSLYGLMIVILTNLIFEAADSE
mgnify:FL=1